MNLLAVKHPCFPMVAPGIMLNQNLSSDIVTTSWAWSILLDLS